MVSPALQLLRIDKLHIEAETMFAPGCKHASANTPTHFASPPIILPVIAAGFSVSLFFLVQSL